jgi:hypothetical protein
MTNYGKCPTCKHRLAECGNQLICNRDLHRYTLHTQRWSGLAEECWLFYVGYGLPFCVRRIGKDWTFGQRYKCYSLSNDI